MRNQLRQPVLQSAVALLLFATLATFNSGSGVAQTTGQISDVALPAGSTQGGSGYYDLGSEPVIFRLGDQPTSAMPPRPYQISDQDEPAEKSVVDDQQWAPSSLAGPAVPGDGAFHYDFYEPPKPGEAIFELLPRILTKPNEPLGNLLSHILHHDRDEIETELHDDHHGIQYIPERPPLIIEWNERFLGPGTLKQGIETPFGAVRRPAVWVWGETRSAIQYFDNGVTPSIAEWANRIDLFAQLNLSGTERLLYAVRPVDEENATGSARRFAGIDFEDSALPGGNFDTQSLFFEGDLGEMFPRLDPYDNRWLDIGFSMGRLPLLAQQGLLINEDRMDAVTLTRNTINGLGNLNLRVTGVYSWDQITRNSPIAGNPNIRDNNSQMYAILTESDFFTSTVNVDAAYVGGDQQRGNMVAVGVSSIRRHYLQHNTYNTSIHALGSFPTNGRTDYADQGELLFGQLSWTPHHYVDLIYLNAFLAVDQFTSPARGPLMGGPLGQTGILFSAAGVGRFGAPISVRTNQTAGASLGYQWFFDETRQQVVWEFGGAGGTSGGEDGAIGTAMNYQRACGQHFIFVLGGAVAKRESADTGVGVRTEIRTKF